MAAIMDVIRSYLDHDTLVGLGKRVGAGPSIVHRVASTALPMLIGGLSRNLNGSPQGRSSLNAALERDHDGSLLDGLGSLLRGAGAGGGLGGLVGAVSGLLGGGGERAASPRANNGDGILATCSGTATTRSRRAPHAPAGSIEEASGGEDVASWADRLQSALDGSLFGRKDRPG